MDPRDASASNKGCYFFYFIFLSFSPFWWLCIHRGLNDFDLRKKLEPDLCQIIVWWVNLTHWDTSVYHREQNRLDYHLNVLWLLLPGFLNFVVLTGACNLGNLIPVIAKLSYFNVALFFDVQDLFCRHLLFWHRQYIIPSATLTFWILFLGPGPNIVYPSHRLTH